jgi:hypothetical protein
VTRSLYSPRTLVTTLGVVVALSAMPADGQAATTFGSRLDTAPNAAPCPAAAAPPCTTVGFSRPGAGNPVVLRSPVSGVITKVRLRAVRTGTGPATVRFRLANIAPAGNEGAAATAIGPAGPTVTVAGTGAVEEFPARLPVGTGSHLALDTAGVAAVHTGSGLGYVFAPRLVSGAGLRASSAATGELLVQARVEPDADHDGFGDETQDRVRPRLGRVKVRRGRVAFTLSEKARVSMRLTRVGGRGGARTVQRTILRARRGANRARLAGRVRPGRYRLTLVAIDAAGNRSGARRFDFPTTR